ncbi:class I SAM-dependent methyltransferase [Chloroflexota bacterium]
MKLTFQDIWWKVKKNFYGHIFLYIDGFFVSLRLFFRSEITTQEIIDRNSANTFGNPYRNQVEFNDETARASDKYSEEHVELIINGMKLNKDVKIVDVGCRNGKFLEMLYKRGYSNLCGVEVVPEWVQFAHSVGRHYVKQGEITEYNLSEKADLIYCRHTLEHLVKPQKTLETFNSWAENGGYIILIFPLTRIRTNKHLAFIPSMKYFEKLISQFNWQTIVFDYTDNIDTSKIFGKFFQLTPYCENEITYIGKKHEKSHLR